MKPRYARRKPHEYNEQWKIMCKRMGRPYNYPFKILKLDEHYVLLDDCTKGEWRRDRFNLIEFLYVNKKKGA